MITEIFRSAGSVKARYVRKARGSDNVYQWCEQSAVDTRYDLAQGTCEASDLPDDIRKKCDEYDGCFYACEWPMEDLK